MKNEKIVIKVKDVDVFDLLNAYKDLTSRGFGWDIVDGVLTVTEKKSNSNYLAQQISAKNSLGYSM